MGSFEMHVDVNFAHCKVNQVRAEAIPMHQQRAHLDLPRYTVGSTTYWRS